MSIQRDEAKAILQSLGIIIGKTVCRAGDVGTSLRNRGRVIVSFLHDDGLAHCQPVDDKNWPKFRKRPFLVRVSELMPLPTAPETPQ